MKVPDKIYLHGYPGKPFLCQDWDVAPTKRVVRGKQAENIAYIRADLAELTAEDVGAIVEIWLTMSREKMWREAERDDVCKEVLRRFLESKKG